MPDEETAITTHRRAVAMVRMYCRGDGETLLAMVEDMNAGGGERVMATILALMDFAKMMMTEFGIEDSDAWLDRVLTGMALADADHQVRLDEDEER